ncbi:cobyric acid synthase [Pseudohoeflea coraliihabitans]|uniref:Cobyric acid synthase n=1 Tax=Pseudohoeflea coraliihabitans TaxID=2860393 RepID=A0ABS6WKV3_9HYPH|nr:cobyric acid synthase [Pseudohoeflea sp. DP4N28-3]MBW3095760.1 cobyric acid synthase [Pseudohoeflea sp. DP4N28-3]
MTGAIMMQGTGSDVGKTVLVAGLCRLLANRGLAVRPFKPQNMSNNAAVAEDGGEIGRAQWLQALACRTPASVHMNPVLLKPQSETGSQIIVHGKVWGQAQGRDYQRLKTQLLAPVLESFTKVAAAADIVLVEGAGSPAEINLRGGDIANMGFARAANVPVVLVGDIDRGGVIASLVGTHALLDEDDRSMVRGYLINKFRGDAGLFAEGVSAIERFTGWPCFGIVPWLQDARRLPAEDSVVLERLADAASAPVKIAVPMISRMANFDDFDALAAEPEVELCFVRPGERLPADAALVILPGTKSTISDLVGFREQGWDRDLEAHLKAGGRVLGICGGLQMLGRHISDPHGIEGPLRQAEGLGLLDIETELRPRKTVRNVTARSVASGADLSGYEIHMGVTRGADCLRPFAMINSRPDGACSADGRVAGTYLHGFFDSDAYRATLLSSLGGTGRIADYRAEVDKALDRIAATLEDCVDVAQLLHCAAAGADGAATHCAGGCD